MRGTQQPKERLAPLRRRAHPEHGADHGDVLRAEAQLPEAVDLVLDLLFGIELLDREDGAQHLLDADQG